MYLVSTIAGSNKGRGHRDGRAEESLFNKPQGICVDSRKNVFVADCCNHCIRFISSGGQVSTLAGIPGEIMKDRDYKYLLSSFILT